ncbi:hypothetical protein OFO11_32485, partial [Escherichia coli]|nr:hypothetical protein [Escherichia coli]
MFDSISDKDAAIQDLISIKPPTTTTTTVPSTTTLIPAPVNVTELNKQLLDAIKKQDLTQIQKL